MQDGEIHRIRDERNFLLEGSRVYALELFL